jgi:hypothetical protein
MVFATLLKNDLLLNKDSDVIDQMLHPEKSGRERKSLSIPDITSLDDVYETGVLCKMKAIKDEHNFLMPYILNLFPIEKATILSALHSEEQIKPLC